MIKKHNDLITEFIILLKKDNPELAILKDKEIMEAILSPWNFLKQEISSAKLEEIRFKYFGTFKVYKGRAKNMLFHLNNRLKFNKISKEKYNYYTNMIKKYLENEN